MHILYFFGGVLLYFNYLFIFNPPTAFCRFLHTHTHTEIYPHKQWVVGGRDGRKTHTHRTHARDRRGRVLSSFIFPVCQQQQQQQAEREGEGEIYTVQDEGGREEARGGLLLLLLLLELNYTNKGGGHTETRRSLVKRSVRERERERDQRIFI